MERQHRPTGGHPHWARPDPPVLNRRGDDGPRSLTSGQAGEPTATDDYPAGPVSDGDGGIAVNNYSKTVVRIEPDGAVVALGTDGPPHPPLAFDPDQRSA
jgi:hypothetical protein